MILGITFNNPWFLFALVIGLALALIPHFRIAKRYRRNRTRIVSLVLHIVVVILSVFTLAGMEFNYTEKNDHNQIILLVDSSNSVTDSSEEARDDVVNNILSYGKYDGYQIGIVKFGFDQEYAVPLTSDISSIYKKYLESNDPDVHATDIAAALNYTKNLFTYPETSKIVLITDGVETDENSLQVIRSISATGIKVDTVQINGYDDKLNDYLVTNVEMPNTHISKNEEIQIKYEVRSLRNTDVVIKVYDNGKELVNEGVACTKGLSSHTAKLTFTEDGFHDVSVVVSSNDDVISYNNEYHTFVNIETFNKVLIVKRDSNETDDFKNLLERQNDFVCEVLDLSGDYDAVFTVDFFRQYDQVVLQNVHHDDMPFGFEESLQEYVSVYGGALFTLGGDDGSGNSNAYKRDGSYGTIYQDMLPVQLIDYTPPVGVIFIIDKSGSMGASANDGSGNNLLEYAELGCIAALQGLTERDYVGIMTLDDKFGLVLDLTPRTEKSKIISAINSIGSDANGGTVFEYAYKNASQLLIANNKVEKKHIIIISDGLPSAKTNPETGNLYYEDFAGSYYDDYGISTSVVLLNGDKTSKEFENMKKMTDKGHGNVYAVNDFSGLGLDLLNDLAAPEITEVSEEEFNPKVTDVMSNITNGLTIGAQNTLDFVFGGFYGTKAKAESNVIITGNFDVPLYAQWSYGKGMVGSLMTNVSNSWSKDLYNTTAGEIFIKNIVRTLMPNEPVRSSGIDLVIKSDNYINQLSVYTTLEENTKLRGTIECMTADGKAVNITELPENLDLRNEAYYMISELGPDNDYTRCSFILRDTGVYKITVEKVNENGEVLATGVIFKEFSYSKEYSYLESTPELSKELLQKLANRGNGKLVESNDDPYEVFEGFVTSLKKTYDPRILFMILVIVLFLADIAVRKFKFKWPHELVRSYKANRKKK